MVTTIQSSKCHCNILLAEQTGDCGTPRFLQIAEFNEYANESRRRVNCARRGGGNTLLGGFQISKRVRFGADGILRPDGSNSGGRGV